MMIRKSVVIAIVVATQAVIKDGFHCSVRPTFEIAISLHAYPGCFLTFSFQFRLSKFTGMSNSRIQENITQTRINLARNRLYL